MEEKTLNVEHSSSTNAHSAKWWKRPIKFMDHFITYLNWWAQSGSQEDALRWWNSRGTMPLNDEIVFSKNNVCIHPPALLNASASELHHPGYLTLRCQKDEVLGHSLILTWIPNSSLNNSSVSRDISSSTTRTDISQNFNYSTTSESPDNPDIFESSNKYSLNHSASACTFEPFHEESNLLTGMSLKEEDIGDENLLGSCQSTPTRHVVKQSCGVFYVDLGLMRSVRIFYSQGSLVSGQVVIASREAQYKVLHFHHGGLDKFDHSLADWRFLTRLKSSNKDKSSPLHYKVYTVVRPRHTGGQKHPEESNGHTPVTQELWRDYVNPDGQIQSDYLLRKAIFFGGLDPDIRSQAWLFLLEYYPFDSTHEEKDALHQQRFQDYCKLRHKFKCYMDILQSEESTDSTCPPLITDSSISSENIAFARHTLATVEKDVIRTDRRNPYYAGQGNKNLEVLQELLLTYALANPSTGYHQGMSDLAAPLLAHLQEPSVAYWCFESLIQRSMFCSSPTDSDMDKQLGYLRELLRIMEPTFFKYLLSLGEDATEMLFCHRWLLLCFKREFYEPEALRIWEACWCRYATDYFHLFVVVAVIRVYGSEVVDQHLPSDDLLLHFSSLAGHMDVEVILVKARYLLHEFRSLATIPCTLSQLCVVCGPGMWDSGHAPSIVCVNHTDLEPCLYKSKAAASS